MSCMVIYHFVRIHVYMDELPSLFASYEALIRIIL